MIPYPNGFDNLKQGILHKSPRPLVLESPLVFWLCNFKSAAMLVTSLSQNAFWQLSSLKFPGQFPDLKNLWGDKIGLHCAKFLREIWCILLRTSHALFPGDCPKLCRCIAILLVQLHQLNNGFSLFPCLLVSVPLLYFSYFVFYLSSSLSFRYVLSTLTKASTSLAGQVRSSHFFSRITLKDSERDSLYPPGRGLLHSR